MQEREYDMVSQGGEMKLETQQSGLQLDGPKSKHEYEEQIEGQIGRRCRRRSKESSLLREPRTLLLLLLLLLPATHHQALSITLIQVFINRGVFPF